MAESAFPRQQSATGISTFEKGTSSGPFLLSQSEPPKRPTWKLGALATLSGEPTVDSIVLRASECLVSVDEGKKLVLELQRLIKKQPGITVEVFEFESGLLARRAQLADTPLREGTGGLNGFTQPIVTGEISPHAGSDEVIPLIHFFVLLKTPPRASPNDFFRNEAEFLEVSETVRLLKMAETLFHEFLHAWFMITIGRDSLAVNPPHIAFDSTGHAGTEDVSFRINPLTLTLEIEGNVEVRFQTRLTKFVSEVVAGHGFKERLEKERKKFKR